MGQWLRITAMNLRSIPARLGVSMVICVGTASVVAVLITVLSMSNGLTKTLVSGAQSDRVVVMRQGALAESLSSMSREAVLAVETAPGIATVDGKKLVSPEIVLSVNLPTGEEGLETPVFVRGLTEGGLAVRDDLELVTGRMPQSGRFEVAVGSAIKEQLTAAEIGDVLTFHSNPWTVVGVVSQGGGAAESQVYVDAATAMAASGRTVYSAMRARLADPEGFEAFRQALEDNPQLVVEAKLEADYLEEQAENATGILELIAYVVSGIMAMGALFGAVNTMYTAVSARTAEIATLRAIGFGGSAVAVSVLAEAMVLSFVGALIGTAIAWLMFNGLTFNAGGQLGAIGVALSISPGLALLGIVWACTLGFVAGLFPAVRAARMPVAEGLRIES